MSGRKDTGLEKIGGRDPEERKLLLENGQKITGERKGGSVLKIKTKSLKSPKGSRTGI